MLKFFQRHGIFIYLCLFVFIVALPGCRKTAEDGWHPGKPLDKEKLKIAVIYVDNAESGFSQAHELGIQGMQKALGLSDNQIIRKQNILDTDAMQSEAAVREAILDGANIVFAISWGFDAVCAKFAEIYPNVIFAHATGPLSNGKNFTNYFGRVYQARYLSGVVAGLKTKTNMLGYVAAKGKENSEVTGGLNAFAMGVESVNPKAKVYVVVTHNWDDSEAERLATRKLIQFGCDVIAQHCNLATPQIEAQKAGVWGIGYNTDMFPFAPDAVLTSVVWNWGAYYTKMVKSVIDGTFDTEPYFGGLEDGIVALAPLNRALSGEAINDAVVKARKRIEDGFAVFEDVLETNDARFIGRVGEVFADDYIRFKIDWYYRNVEELQ